MVPHALELYEFLGRMLGKVLYEVGYLPAGASPHCNFMGQCKPLACGQRLQVREPTCTALLLMPASKQAHLLSYHGACCGGASTCQEAPLLELAPGRLLPANLEAYLCGAGPGTVKHIIEDCHLPSLQGILVELPLAGFFLKKVRTMRADVNDLYTLDPELYNNLMFLRDYKVSRALPTWTTTAQHMCGEPVARQCLACLLSCWIALSGWAALPQQMLLTEAAASCLQGDFGDLALSFTTSTVPLQYTLAWLLSVAGA